MARKPATARHLAEIGPRPEFKFSDVQWKRIAAEMVNARDRDQYRGLIECAARELLNARQNPEGYSGYKSPQQRTDRAAIKKVASSAPRLFRALHELSGYALFDLEGPFNLIWQGRGLPAATNFTERGEPLRMFIAELSHLADIAPYFVKAGFGARGPKVPANVDLNRNGAWAAATSWWERATGKRAKAYERAPAHKRRPADGAIVRFLQEFTEAIPGEKCATGDQIRSLLRTYWSKGKKETWQMGKW
jgi:hypothetical protein